MADHPDESADDPSRVKALRALVEGFDALGYHVSDAGGRIPFPPLALEFRITDVTWYPRRDNFVVQMLIEAAASGDNREGVRANAVGLGPTEAAALRGAADQWIDSVFPVLHHWLAPHPSDVGVLVREMLTAGDDSSQRFGWRVHLGPPLFVCYRGGEVSPDTLPGQDAILLALFDELTALSAHETIFWVQAFVGRVPASPPRATCLLRNRPWPEAEAALLAWAVAEESLAGMSARQFIMFEPVDPGTLKSVASLSSSLEAELANSENSPPKQ